MQHVAASPPTWSRRLGPQEQRSRRMQDAFTQLVMNRLHIKTTQHHKFTFARQKQPQIPSSHQFLQTGWRWEGDIVTELPCYHQAPCPTPQVKHVTGQRTLVCAAQLSGNRALPPSEAQRRGSAYRQASAGITGAPTLKSPLVLRDRNTLNV